MSKMKDLLMDILEDYENRTPLKVIAKKHNMTVREVKQIIDEWLSTDFHMV